MEKYKITGAAAVDNRGIKISENNYPTSLGPLKNSIDIREDIFRALAKVLSRVGAVIWYDLTGYDTLRM